MFHGVKTPGGCCGIQSVVIEIEPNFARYLNSQHRNCVNRCHSVTEYKVYNCLKAWTPAFHSTLIVSEEVVLLLYLTSLSFSEIGTKISGLGRYPSTHVSWARQTSLTITRLPLDVWSLCLVSGLRQSSVRIMRSLGEIVPSIDLRGGARLGVWCVARSFVGTRNNWGSSFSRLKLSPNSSEFRVIGPLTRADTRARNKPSRSFTFSIVS